MNANAGHQETCVFIIYNKRSFLLILFFHLVLDLFHLLHLLEIVAFFVVYKICLDSFVLQLRFQTFTGDILILNYSVLI